MWFVSKKKYNAAMAENAHLKAKVAGLTENFIMLNTEYNGLMADLAHVTEKYRQMKRYTNMMYGKFRKGDICNEPHEPNEQTHGQWLQHETMTDVYKCSVCGFLVRKHSRTYNFGSCICCGSEMCVDK